MIFLTTDLPGVLILELEKLEDERGFFARTWCREEARAQGLEVSIAQCNISFSRRKGTLRGLHYQVAPHEESKWIRCIRGSIYDVTVDLRRHSPTFMQWTAVHLTAENRRMLHVAPGCAHGFLTLDDNTEVFYQMSKPYAPEFARGIRWNDPSFGIPWPEPVTVISEKDRECPDFTGTTACHSLLPGHRR